MATIFDFDLEALLSPIPGDNPSGPDIYGEDAWYSIKDLRGTARRAETDIETWDSENGTPPDPMPSWQELVELALEVTNNRSKNLAIVAHLIEALVRTDGFGGLLKGLQLTNGLIERFWDTVYPRPEPGDPAATVDALAQLNGYGGGGLILGPLRRVPITNDPGGEAFALWQYLEAHTLKTLPQEDQAKKLERGAISLDVFTRSASATPVDFYRATQNEIEQCVAELARLDEQLEPLLSSDVRPSFSAIREQLEDIQRAIKTIAPADAAESFTTDEAGNVVAAAGAGHGAGGMVVGAVMSREDAFKQLTLIADFFEKTEPLSLLSEQIRKVVRLGRMNPLQYFSELIEDDSIRRQMFKLVGIQPPEE